MPQRNEALPKIEDCIKGRLYKLRCRNLGYGVWNGKDGFIGIREKFGSRYLFTEYHYDTGAPFGTVSHAIDTGFQLRAPERSGYELKTSCDSIDQETGRRCEFRPDDPNTKAPGKWYFLDTGEPGAEPCSYGYAPLFDWIESRSQEHRRRENGDKFDDDRFDMLFWLVDTMAGWGGKDNIETLRRFMIQWKPEDWSTHINVGFLSIMRVIRDEIAEKEKFDFFRGNYYNLWQSIRSNFFSRDMLKEDIDSLLEGLA